MESNADGMKLVKGEKYSCFKMRDEEVCSPRGDRDEYNQANSPYQAMSFRFVTNELFCGADNCPM